MERPYSSVAENLKAVLFNIGEAAAKAGRPPDSVRLMAVTKTVPAKTVNEAISLGIRLLGENRAQELCEKYDKYAKTGVEIHFIGHLQGNKARQIVDKVDMIQSLDRISLAKEIDTQAQKAGKTMRALIEVNIGGEASKSGVAPEGLEELLHEVSRFKSVRVEGLMTIPPVCGSTLDSERYFHKMQELWLDIQAKKIDNVIMEYLSMGMSDDYAAAIKHGANIVRVGTAIFGSRH
jgi:pyridoxal phosphate enzyme (YggS family)